MPLKHATETFLIVVLAVAVIVTGMVMQTLVSLPEGIVPWAILFVIASLYPLLLGKLFRENRADYAFRLLHFVPAIMLLVWLLLQALTLLFPVFENILRWYTWGWSLPAVATGIFLMVGFVLKVIRRWTKRIAFLAILFLPFIVLAVTNEMQGWHQQMASALWQGNWWQIDQDGTGTQVAGGGDVLGGVNLQHSSDPSEEAYRERLRALERRRERIARRLAQSSYAVEMGENGASDINAGSTNDGQTDPGPGPTDTGSMQSQGSKSDSSEFSMGPGMVGSGPGMGIEGSMDDGSSSVMYGQTSSKPSELPHSGFGWSVIILSMMGLYCGVLQRSTLKRIEN